MAAPTDAAQVGETQAKDAPSVDETGRPRRIASPTAIDPIRFEAAVFDLDGVLTETAAIHAQAWKRLFDEFLAKQASASGTAFQPFDAEQRLSRLCRRPPAQRWRAHLPGRARDHAAGGRAGRSARRRDRPGPRRAQGRLLPGAPRPVRRDGVPRRPAVACQPARRGPEDGAGLLQPQRQGGAGSGRPDGAHRRGRRRRRGGAPGAEGQAGAGHLPASRPAARRRRPPAPSASRTPWSASRRSAPPATALVVGVDGWANRASSSRTAPISR